MSSFVNFTELARKMWESVLANAILKHLQKIMSKLSICLCTSLNSQTVYRSYSNDFCLLLKAPKKLVKILIHIEWYFIIL